MNPKTCRGRGQVGLRETASADRGGFGHRPGTPRESRWRASVLVHHFAGRRKDFRSSDLSLDGLIAPDDALRPKAPIIPQRFRPPDLGALRTILVPGARVEIAERFVFHQIHLAEELYPDLVSVAVIDRNVMADDVASGA